MCCICQGLFRLVGGNVASGEGIGKTCSAEVQQKCAESGSQRWASATHIWQRKLLDAHCRFMLLSLSLYWLAAGLISREIFRFCWFWYYLFYFILFYSLFLWAKFTVFHRINSKTTKMQPYKQELACMRAHRTLEAVRGSSEASDNNW